MVVIHSNDPIQAAEELERKLENGVIADRLDEIASLLADQRAGEFRVRSYRRAADSVRQLKRSLRETLEHDGVEGLTALPTIGVSIANLIEQHLRLGRMPLLDRLRGEASAEHYFTTLPGIGPELSHRMHEYLHVETLPELYAAAQDGRLDQVSERMAIDNVRDQYADLNAYAMASDGGGCCVGSSCSSEEQSLHDGLATVMQSFDANAYPASVRVHALKQASTISVNTIPVLNLQKPSRRRKP